MKSARILALGAVASLVLAALGACSRREPPAPVEINTVSRSPVAPAPGVAPGAAGAPLQDTTYVVQRGDTAYALSRQFDVPVKAIIDANGLQPPYGLIAGARLVIPRPRTHLVVAGDTVSSVARRYGVDMSVLVRANELDPPYGLKTGQRLVLPAPVIGAPQTAAAVPPPSAPLPPPVQRPVETGSLPPPSAPAAPPQGTLPPPLTMAPVDSVSQTPPPPRLPQTPPPVPAAAAPPPPPPAAPPPPPPAAPAPVAAAPPNPPPAPPPATAAPVSPPAPAAKPEAEPAPPPQVAAAAPPAVEPEPPKPEPVVAAPPPPPPPPVGPPPPRAGKQFAWPLRGRVIATFGEQGKGLHNDGINIQAPRGTPIRAAENGVVRYAGNEIRGFGNLLLIEHAGGFITAYAHADSLLVKRGDTVHRGQTIARVGATGSVNDPQLHFEVRQDRTPVDPQRYLGSPTS